MKFCTTISKTFFHSVQTFSAKRFISITTMAKSKFEYVKGFESPDNCLPNCWIVVRIDGKNFSKFSKVHNFTKPNDERALNLMRQAATTVMEEFNEIVISYGQSDEFSFVFKKDTAVYNRRASKILSNVNSLFTSSYVFHWDKYMGDVKLQYPPSFDARTVLYPSDENLKDYLSWRQADVHVNNLYNTCFWNLVLKKNMKTIEAQEFLKGTFSADKNELLFQEFGINYNNEPQYFRKGTTLLRKIVTDESGKTKKMVVPFIGDIIGERFWRDNPEILGLKKQKTMKTENTSSTTKEEKVEKIAT
ncbi:probable tRNA(His) guanylyltransferase [Venturia canescens]|uniref:probable tRNA(His) guanylyltransferase n=1 Tax=Venturia canescens TaxID=32260 RepID=UPI001C9BFD9F|nr:probable tRNA(His) guanylyltransferase [Venturia canescens]XP_043277178.1 probable tRNA(His) guanylyltransferase [Venturia canescens]